MTTVRVLDREGAGAAVDAVFQGLSPQSRYLRFHAPMPRLTASMRGQLVDLDGCRKAAVVAERGEQAIGIARLAAIGQGVAEMAVAVVDDWQRKGVGTLLVTALGDLATELSYTELVGEVLHENLAVLRLVRRAFPGVRLDRTEDEVIRISYPLTFTLTHEELVADLRW
ncbi:RimJ/RimL family protein N-acetyltransferase [Saccharothrix tamanrassetensis]|uniref:RimJ/RimL family protein N-acetyltransferase n=1 Tax=Saccharothrix tamanrassetensis TaxID=1051531 RepID=A0A841CIC2_9PSEU|nr:GNAT family N-acetyltransferase [Saccharothrix tamanrassetensis]MBB5955948.1 RimJ/RimL family protein N-acetyltransferase [Saccharothrix tamanrassetensis]